MYRVLSFFITLNVQMTKIQYIPEKNMPNLWKNVVFIACDTGWSRHDFQEFWLNTTKKIFPYVYSLWEIGGSKTQSALSSLRKIILITRVYQWYTCVSVNRGILNTERAL